MLLSAWGIASGAVSSWGELEAAPLHLQLPEARHFSQRMGAYRIVAVLPVRKAVLLRRFRAGVSGRRGSVSRVVDGMSSELVAHGGDELHGRGIVLAGRESREQGGRDRWHGNRAVDGLLDRPPSLARVVGPAADRLQIWFVRQGG